MEELLVALEKSKSKSYSLLNQILPEHVAEELMVGTTVTLLLNFSPPLNPLRRLQSSLVTLLDLLPSALDILQQRLLHY